MHLVVKFARNPGGSIDQCIRDAVQFDYCEQGVLYGRGICHRSGLYLWQVPEYDRGSSGTQIQLVELARRIRFARMAIALSFII